MKEMVNIKQSRKYGMFPFLKTFNLQLMSILGRTLSLFALMNKMFLSFFIIYVCAKTVVGLKVVTLCLMILFKIHLFGKILS